MVPVLSLYRRIQAARFMETMGMLINNGIAVRYCTEGCSDPPDEVTFSYTITDGHMGTASAVVTVEMPEGGIINSTPLSGDE